MAEEPIFDLLDDINRLTRTVSSRDRSHATVHSIDNGQMYGGWKPVDGASEPAWQLPVAVASDEPQRIHLRRDPPEMDRSSFNNVNVPEPGLPPSKAASSHPTEMCLRAPQSQPLVQGIRLLSIRELPDRCRSIFPFRNFNAVQSKCFETIYRGDSNFVLSAPTGSGKTAIFELAICRLIGSFTSGEYKVVYQAPTKSLCSERLKDWQEKFAPLGLTCTEATGDTEQRQLNQVRDANIIITTPEKWDSMTRKWKDHAKLMQLVKLFLIDEVHMLKDERGATLEAVVSRMKSIGTNVRFVALSATVPNADDIAIWLGKNSAHQHLPASREHFGEEFRPVVLQKHICAYPSHGSNTFAFEKTLNSKLTDVIAKYSRKKPIMIFCSTRKNAAATAKLLTHWWTINDPSNRYWGAPRSPIIVSDEEAKAYVPAGVSFHHAGLSQEDRAAVESGFLQGNINVICCTSTLAVGVNLPCHFVIVKGTMNYQNNTLTEMSDLEVIQMLGRAGRPQFDRNAVAVIMTRQETLKRWEKLVSGEEILESCLHLNLIEHLNAELVLGTITSLRSAKDWLSGTFLFVRLQKNPQHYRFSGISGYREIGDILDDICRRDIALLQEAELVTTSEPLRATQYGVIVAQYSVHFETAKRFLSLPRKAKISEILSVLSQADEFSDMRFRSGEKTAYKDLNKSPSIKFPIPVNLDLPAHKVSLIVQSVLGEVELPVETPGSPVFHQYQVEKAVVFHQLKRLIRCIIDFEIQKEDSNSLRNSLMVFRSVASRCWDDSPLQMKQIDQIGPVAVRKLVNAGIKTLDVLEDTEPHRIEAVLGRAPPFGRKILDFMSSFPKLRVSMQIIGQKFKSGQGAEINLKVEVAFLNEKPPEYFRGDLVYVVIVAETTDGRKIFFARLSAKKFGKGQDFKFLAHLKSPTQHIICHVMCDEIAGSLRSAVCKPTIPSIAWPSQQPVNTVHNTSSTSVAILSRIGMNTSRKRSENTPGYRASSRASASDEFGLGDIDDADLLVVAEQAENDDYADIDDLDGSFLRRAVHAKDPITNKSNDASEQNWTPTRLPNDKFACNHRCKDRDRCKHQCCREGLDKPPKGPPKWLLKSGKKEELTSNRSSTRSGEKKQTRLTSGGRLKGSSTQSQASGTAEIDLTNEPTGLNKVDSATSHDWSLPHLNPTLNHGPQGKSYRFSRSLGQTLGSTEGGLLSFLPSSTHFNQGYESACEKAPSPELYPAQKENTDSPAHYSSDILKGSRTAREKDDYAYSDVSEAALELNHMGTGFDDTPIQIPRAENDDNPAYNIGSDEDLDDLIDWNPRAPSVSLMNPETSTVEAVSAENFHTDYEMGTRHHLALESLYSAPTSKRRAAGAEGASPFIPDPSATASSPSDLIRAESTSPFWKKVKHRHHGSRTANGVEGTNNAIRPQSPTPAVPQNGIEHAKLHAPSLWETPTGDEEGLLLQEFGSCVDFV